MGKNRIREVRKSAGVTLNELSERSGFSTSYLSRMEASKRNISIENLSIIAGHLGVRPSDLIEEHKTVPLVGYVGAGSIVESFEDGQGPFDEVPAPDNATEKTVAVKIRGDCMGPFLNNWNAFYDREILPPTPEMMGKLCIVGLNDGRVLLKKISAGTMPGLYKLESQFEPPIYDELVLWACPVTALMPNGA